MKRSMRGDVEFRILRMLAMSVFLLSILMGCSLFNPETIVPEVVYEKSCPPSSLTSDIPITEYGGRSWGDLVEYTYALRAVISKQNADKAGIRAWCED